MSTSISSYIASWFQLYVGECLANWAEVKITYNIDLVTNLPTGEPLSFVADASDFLATLGVDTSLDGALNSYFCDPETQEEIPTGVPTHQGSIISICFNVVDGQFEVGNFALGCRVTPDVS